MMMKRCTDIEFKVSAIIPRPLVAFYARMEKSHNYEFVAVKKTWRVLVNVLLYRYIASPKPSCLHKSVDP